MHLLSTLPPVAQSLILLLSIYLLALLAIFGIRALLYRANISTRFRYDRDNPFRRHCMRCGAQQNQYRYAVGGDQWEYMGGGNDPECSCRLR